MSVQEIFFTQFDEFLTALIEMYPDDTDFVLLQTSVNGFYYVTPKYVIQTFYDSIKPYEEHVLAKNESFFLDNTFEEADMNILSKLQSYVRGMSPATKKHVWQYLHNLLRLAKASLSQ